ncbi:hypothetical protein Fleli_1799 [Bernardetia litoralis DSM 6794]|uniref:Uncharacterized protein n=1 Tax=Bernardetia litoralis (strain ATCC 23117 / DSM 6794 / NBRC 15988 / NCIMB 1366 / Fx l1 / Sio-4) TaxID=880071 RepID=I4AJR2_BERLS|nr:hypothetical protein [Bernardetia litoralis]AFM04197.1 hypothetical protein Fleli_1799 [Bernardetia litoralis DSM 6794]
MFDRPEERNPRNTGRVNNKTENIVSEDSKNKNLYIIIGVLGIILLIAGGIFIFNLGKNSNSKPYSSSESEIAITENTVLPSKIQEIPFQELVGEYTGSINNKIITVNIFLEGTKKRYTYSENKRLSYMLFHFPATNDINFHKPKEGLAEFRAFKEGNTIILRSPNVELLKTK